MRMRAIGGFLDKVDYEGLEYAALEWDWPGLKEEDFTLYWLIESYKRAFKRLEDYVDVLIEEEI